MCFRWPRISEYKIAQHCEQTIYGQQSHAYDYICLRVIPLSTWPAFLRISLPSCEPCQRRLDRQEPRVLNFIFSSHSWMLARRTKAPIDTIFMKSDGGPAFLRISPPSRELCQRRLDRKDPRVLNCKFSFHSWMLARRTKLR